MEIDYLKSIRSIKNKIKSSRSCNQEGCQAMKDRLQKHVKQHHSSVRQVETLDVGTQDGKVKKDLVACGTQDEQSIIFRPAYFDTRNSNKTTPEMDSNTSLETNMCQKFYVSFSNSVQSEFIAADSISSVYKRKTTESPCKINNNVLVDSEPNSLSDVISVPQKFKADILSSDFLPNLDDKLWEDSDSRESIPLLRKETKVLSIKNSTYSEDIEDEVNKWLQDIHVKLNVPASVKAVNRDKIKTFMEQIGPMSNEIDENTFEDKLKIEINKFLDNLSIFTLKSQNEQSINKKICSMELLGRIKSINKHTKDNDSLNTDDWTDDKQLSASKRRDIVENEIKNWLSKIKLIYDTSQGFNSAKKVEDIFIKRLSDVLNEHSNSKMYKLILKGEIVDLLLKLPIQIQFHKNKMLYFFDLSEELANALFHVSGVPTNPSSNTHDNMQHITDEIKSYKYLSSIHMNNDLKTECNKLIKYILTTNNIQSNLEIDDDIVNIIIENIDSIKLGNDKYIEELIFSIIHSYKNLTELKAAELAHIIIKGVKDIAKKELSKEKPTSVFIQPQLSGVISMYNTEEKYKMFTSTPKKQKNRDVGIPKLYPEQTSYLKNLSAVVRDWINTLPVNFDTTEDVIFIDTMVSDLAGNLMAAIKYDQIVNGLSKYDKRTKFIDKESRLKEIIFLWLNRYGIFDDITKCAREIENIYSKVIEIPVPILTRPHHGTRQTIAKTAWFEGENYYNEYEYIPKGIDVLEDNISMWVNERSDIFTFKDGSMRGRMVKTLAQDVQERLVSKHTENEIMNDIHHWLKETVKLDKKEHIPSLMEELKNRIQHIPQDITLDNMYLEKIIELDPEATENHSPEVNASKTFNVNFVDSNATIKKFIEKLIQKNYDIEDPLTRKVFSYTLKKDLLKLSPENREYLYRNYEKIGHTHLFSTDQFGQELEYIKILSDWVNMLPVDPNYNALKNKHYIEVIQNLAKYVVEIEHERATFPNAMDYDAYLTSIILAYAVHLPIPKEQKLFLRKLTPSLLIKIKKYAKSAAKNHVKLKINSDDLGAFIAEFIREYGQDVVDDPLKFQVWTDRLTEEVLNFARETADPMLLNKTQIYNKLKQVPLPAEDSVALFGLELEYAVTITDWLKNLPLKIVLNKSEEQTLVTMISDLVDKMIDRTIKKTDSPHDVKVDADIGEFIQKWLFELPLETYDGIVVPVVIQQLINRIDKVNEPPEPRNSCNIDQTSDSGKKNITKPTKTKLQCKSKQCKEDPENAIIDAVEGFCNALHIPGSNEAEIKSLKEEMTKKVLQKICNLNADASIFYDERLFKEMFRDQLDMILERIPQDEEPNKNEEKLKETLINSVVELESVIKEQSAGEHYKQKLENTIEGSIPNPVQISQVYDPGFEFYKNRLATMFILENFDHANDNIKVKYEKRIQNELDKYFEFAQNRNAVPLSKHQIQNELYSALFKVPIPNESSLEEQVEGAKTRFEIDSWYELLPVIQTDNLNELLERDKILSALAKRIHEIESVEKNADPYIEKEIIKCILKLPLLPGNSENIDELANQLQKRLKFTFKDRKCIQKEMNHSKGKSKDKEKKKTNQTLRNTIVSRDSIKEKSSVTNSRPSSPTQALQVKPAADLILEAVETWCNQLPLPASNSSEVANSRRIRDNVGLNIALKISELNSNPEIFADEYAYDIELGQEIDKLTYNLPLQCDLKCRQAGKQTLIEIIGSIKRLVTLEREKFVYREFLKQTVCSLLEESHKSDQAEIVKPSKVAVDKIVDDFVKYNFTKDNVEERNVHKINVHDTVAEHLSDIKTVVHRESEVNPLILSNQLICEMSKVMTPGEKVLQDMIEEIRMKDEIDDFFQKLNFSKLDEKKTIRKEAIKVSLNDKLLQLVRNGQDNDIKTEINKCLNTLGKKASPEVIDDFVRKLRVTKISRKAISLQPNISKGIHPQSPTYQGNHSIRPINRSIAMKSSNIIAPAQNIQGVRSGIVFNHSMNHNVATGTGILSSEPVHFIIEPKLPPPTEIPAEVITSNRHESPKYIAMPQQIPFVLTPSKDALSQHLVRVTQTTSASAPGQVISAGPSAPTSAPSAILPARPTTNAHNVGETQPPQNLFPSERRRPDEYLPAESNKGCKCNLRRTDRKRKRICMRSRYFPLELDYCIPSPFIWWGM